MFTDLTSVPTCVLVEELKSREAVNNVWVDPYVPFEVNVNGKVVRNEDVPKTGPVVILTIWD
jgi:hypothetical protein